MSELQPPVTRKRLLAGIAVLLVATAVLIPLGVEPLAYLLGVAAGIIVVGLVAYWTFR